MFYDLKFLYSFLCRNDFVIDHLLIEYYHFEFFMDFKQVLIPFGDFLISNQDSECVSYIINKSSITENTDDQFSFSSPIRKAFETTHPDNFEPGIIFVLEDDSTKFFSYFEKDFIPISLTVQSESIILNNFCIIYIEENNLYCLNNEQKNILDENIPEDSYFICSDSYQGLLISPSKPYALIVTSKKIQTIPHGFATNMISATFFDSDSIAFATNDKKVHLYNKNNEMITVETESNVIKMEAADLISFERTLVCLTEEKSIILVHFKSKSINAISSSSLSDSLTSKRKKSKGDISTILDFCVVHTPFDRVVFISDKGKIQFAVFEKNIQMNTAIKSIIEAFDSRIITGLEILLDMRKRLTFRNQLSSNENPQLPIMIPLFGSLEAEKKESENGNEDDNGNEDKEGSKDELQFWIENIEGTNFEIHCNSEDSLFFDVIICSQKVKFSYAYTIENISEGSYKVICSFEIESINGYDSFSVFVKFDNKNEDDCLFHFVGFIDIPITELAKSKEIKRVSEDYFVSFPLAIPFSHQTMQSSLEIQPITSSPLEESLKKAKINYEPADKGIVLHITADSVNDFQKKASVVFYSLPEASTFKRKENTEKQISIAKNLSQCIEKFLQSMIMQSDLSIEKKRLIIFKTEIDDLLSSFLW